MPDVLVLIAAPRAQPLDHSTLATAIEAMRGVGARIESPRWLAPGEAVDLMFDGAPTAIAAAVAGMLAGRAIDVATVPAAGRRKRLLIADMDSTIIENETLDELADAAGVGARVAAITARSMRGEIDFADALRERVAMLAGLEVAALARTAARMRLSPGAETLVRTMRRAGATTALVSGGFRFCTDLVRARVGFDLDQANDLALSHGRLTGKVVEPVLDGAAKLAALQRLAAQCNLTPADCLAVGDGANDLPMVEAAGLGVAYRGKPILAATAAVRIDHADLTALLYLQGYTKAEFVTA
ncbi:MAG: phosphoserine phosphatase SerB [Proteobacteria bacterium]|nr:phosphoserine phosphatase SerB [Pseudomonadota bacterium]